MSEMDGDTRETLEARIAKAEGAEDAQRDLYLACADASDMHLERGELVHALALAERCLKAAQTQLERSPDKAQALFDVAGALEQVARVRIEREEFREAEAALASCLVLRCRLSELDPSRRGRRADLAIVYEDLHFVSLKQGAPARAEEFIRASVHHRTWLAASAPDSTALRALGSALSKLSQRLVERCAFEEARPVIEQRLECMRTLLERDREDLETTNALCGVYEDFADLLRLQGCMSESLAMAQRSLELSLTLTEREPTEPEWLRGLGIAYEKVANVLMLHADVRPAREALENGLRIRLDLNARWPGEARYSHDLSVSYERLSDVARILGDVEAAQAFITQCIGIRESLREHEPTDPVWLHSLSVAYHHAAQVLDRMGETNAAGVMRANSVALQSQ